MGATHSPGVGAAGGQGVDAADLHDLSVAGGQQGLGAAGLHGVGAAGGHGLGVAGVQQGLHAAGGHGQGPSDMAGEAQQLAPCTSRNKKKNMSQQLAPCTSRNKKKPANKKNKGKKGKSDQNLYCGAGAVISAKHIAIQSTAPR